MALDSYTNLKAEIADWLDRDDLTARIDTFIDLTEAKLAREIRVRAMLRRARRRHHHGNEIPCAADRSIGA